jgi:hypothetical protein
MRGGAVTISAVRVFAAFAVMGACGGAEAASSLERSLMKLNPEERAHQTCAIKGLEVVRRDKRLSKADRLVPDTFKRAQFDGGIVSAKGAAVRANKHWYAMTFNCTLSPDHLKAVDFTFELGAEIPPERWEEVGLWQ